MDLLAQRLLRSGSKTMGQAGSLVALNRIDNAKARRWAACRLGCPEVPAARVKSENSVDLTQETKRWSATAAKSPSRGRGRGAKADVPGNPVVDRNSPRTPSKDPLRLSATGYDTSAVNGGIDIGLIIGET